LRFPTSLSKKPGRLKGSRRASAHPDDLSCPQIAGDETSCQRKRHLVKEAIVLKTDVVKFSGRPAIRAGVFQGLEASLTVARAADTMLADTFPASDPPSWTPSSAETQPGILTAVERAPTTSSPSPGWLQVVASVAGAVTIALAFPLLVVGLPLALAWRAVLASTRWRSPR
jgi:hypothetical protein